MMFIVASVAIIIAMALALLRAVLGPTLYDRVLAGNSFGTKTVLLLGVMGYLTGRPDFLDIALLYALINFVGTIAILKFFRYRTMSIRMEDVRGASLQRGHIPGTTEQTPVLDSLNDSVSTSQKGGA